MRNVIIPFLIGMWLTATPSWLSAHAYEIAPIVQEFAPSGAGAVRSFTVRNTQSEPVALQIEMFRRGVDENGVETREPENEDFIVSPPQLVVAPGASQVVRVHWIGDPKPDHELSYRMVVSQIPIRYQKETTSEINASVQLGYTYEVAVYITPPRAKPLAEIISVEPALDAAGAQVMRVRVKSAGDTRAILIDPILTVTPESGGPTVELKGEAVKGLNMRNFITGYVSVVDVPWPSSLPYAPIKATLTTKYHGKD